VQDVLETGIQMRRGQRTAKTVIATRLVAVGTLQGGTAWASSPKPAPPPAAPKSHSGHVGTPVGAYSATTLAKIAQANSQRKTHMSTAVAASTTVAVTFQIQQESQWCVPADGRVLISAFSSVPPSQYQLASEMGTSDTSGTTYESAMPVINSHESGNNYVKTAPPDAGSLYWYINLDLTSYHAPTMTGVRGADLPLWSRYGLDGAHSIVEYGNAGDGSSIYMWDSLDYSAVNGRSTIAASTLYYAMNDSSAFPRYDELVW
jgi:flagellar capping protein FliD